MLNGIFGKTDRTKKTHKFSPKNKNRKQKWKTIFYIKMLCILTRRKPSKQTPLNNALNKNDMAKANEWMNNKNEEEEDEEPKS